MKETIICQERQPNIELRFGDLKIYIVRNKKTNFIQRKIWKILLGIEIRNLGGTKDGR